MYLDTRPFHTGTLIVSGGHQLYFEQSGSRNGVPVVFLHGGPGAGCSPSQRRLFDPDGYNLLMFDQRGAGKSLPHASLVQNTTQDLVADIEALRVHLGFERWLVFGGSWGSTLALAYAQAHPERVTGLILRGIFLCRDRDIQWFYQEGASRIFPEAWQDFIAPIAADEQSDLVSAYYRLLTGEDEVARMRAAEAWSRWEGRTAFLRAQQAEGFSDPHFALSLARIECHYFMNHGFFRANQLLDDAPRLKGIPGVIVQGRYDMICPPEQAVLLHQAWPESELKMIADAGHAASEPGISKALLEATDNMLALLK